jgi:general stress protein YciG
LAGTAHHFLTIKNKCMPNRNQGDQKGGQSNQGGKGNSERGFAGMDPEEQRRISSEGGKASHEKGTGHEFTSEEAREAGKKGGEARGGNQGGGR